MEAGIDHLKGLLVMIPLTFDFMEVIPTISAVFYPESWWCRCGWFESIQRRRSSSLCTRICCHGHGGSDIGICGYVMTHTKWNPLTFVIEMQPIWVTSSICRWMKPLSFGFARCCFKWIYERFPSWWPWSNISSKPIHIRGMRWMAFIYDCWSIPYHIFVLSLWVVDHRGFQKRSLDFLICHPFQRMKKYFTLRKEWRKIYWPPRGVRYLHYGTYEHLWFQWLSSLILYDCADLL